MPRLAPAQLSSLVAAPAAWLLGCLTPERACAPAAQCSICRMEFEPEDTLRVLRCCHAEHAECVDQWLAVNKSCPLCQKELVPTPPGATASAAEEMTSPSMVCGEAEEMTSPLEMMEVSSPLPRVGA